MKKQIIIMGIVLFATTNNNAATAAMYNCPPTTQREYNCECPEYNKAHNRECTDHLDEYCWVDNGYKYCSPDAWAEFVTAQTVTPPPLEGNGY